MDIQEYRLIAKTALFHSTFSVQYATFLSMNSPKTHNSASSLNTLYTVESTQIYTAFSHTTISLTLRFCGKSEVWLNFFAKDAHNDPKTRSYEENANYCTFSAATLSYALRFRRKQGVIKKISNIWANLRMIFKNVDCIVFCIYKWSKDAKTSLGYENLVHMYL